LTDPVAPAAAVRETGAHGGIGAQIYVRTDRVRRAVGLREGGGGYDAGNTFVIGARGTGCRPVVGYIRVVWSGDGVDGGAVCNIIPRNGRPVHHCIAVTSAGALDCAVWCRKGER